MRLPAAIAIVVMTAAASTGAAEVHFVSPPNGFQAVGAVVLEAATDAPMVDRVEFFVDGVLVGVTRQPPFRVSHDFGSSLSSHRIVAHVRSNHFRSDDTAEIRTAALSAGESMSVDLVEIPLRIRSSGAVTASDLQVTENGVVQSIRDLRAERPPGRFVFIVDRSLSMGGGKLAATFHAIDQALPMLREDDTAQIVLFNHNVARPLAIGHGSSASGVVGSVVPSGGTSLRDAVASIGDDRHTFAIVVTDGGDRNSELNDARALEKISGASIVVDAIVLGGASPFLSAAARNTGGTVIRSDRAGVGDRMHALLDDINSRYTLSYQSHGTAPGWRRVEVTARRHALSIANGRKEYFAE
jgi:hypothetical protein